MISTYERIASKLLSKQTTKPKPYCKFMFGRLEVGTQSLHRTQVSRTWRLFWRLKYFRI
jgi:hypothetical protein